jgi:hypothetical protein
MTMKMGDRLKISHPLWHAMYDRINRMINMINAIAAIVLTGEAPHKVDDTADEVATADAVSGSLDSVGDLEHALDVGYVAHIASTTYHKAADVTNTLTATTVYAKIKALAEDLKAKYNAHHVYTTSSVHAGSGDPNTVTAGTITTKALAIAMLNDIKTMFNLHIINVTSCHGSTGVADAVVLADLTVSATWSQIQAMADAIRAAYVAHVARGTTIHGAADTAHDPAVAAVGSVQTSVDTYLTELKGDLNAHEKESGTSHYVGDDTMKVTVANATTLATSIALANDIKRSFNDHISREGEVAIGPIPTLDEN